MDKVQFKVLYEELAAQGWESYFTEYRLIVDRLKGTEDKIDRALLAKPEDQFYLRLRKLGSKVLANLVRKNVSDIDEWLPDETLEQGVDAAVEAGGRSIAQVRDFAKAALT